MQQFCLICFDHDNKSNKTEIKSRKPHHSFNKLKGGVEEFGLKKS